MPAPISEVISPDEHRERVLAQVQPLPDVAVPLAECPGLVLVEDVRAGVSLPRFDNSAMDGYAVRRAELADVTEDAPVTLPVAGQIGAGQADLRTLPEGTVAKIMTGAPLPDGADAVVPYEWTDRGAEHARITRVPGEAQHVRRAGEDLVAGDLVLAAGTLLGPRQIGLLASIGRAQVRVHRRPRVLVVSTGSELRPPGEPLTADDAIYDGNSFLLAAAAERAGARVQRLGIVEDSPELFLATLRAHLPETDLVVTSGGVSQGDFDVVKAALRDLGVWFGPVAMQPGKPQGFGLLDDAGRAVPIMCLPGNPVSAYISFDCFGVPVLRRMTGRSPEVRPSVTARLTHDITSPAGRRQYLRGDYDGTHATVAPVGGPGSHLLGSLAAANCLIVIPEQVEALAEGAEVDVLVLEEEF